MGGAALFGSLACCGSSIGTPRACSALSATVPCVTLSPSDAQAGEMSDTRLYAAAFYGKVAEVQQLIEVCASIEDPGPVSDRAGTSFAAWGLVWYGV